MEVRDFLGFQTLLHYPGSCVGWDVLVGVVCYVVIGKVSLPLLSLPGLLKGWCIP